MAIKTAWETARGLGRAYIKYRKKEKIPYKAGRAPNPIYKPVKRFQKKDKD